MIGGLISKRTLDVVSRVPILGEIPLIENFFKETNKEERKTTLFIALTPYVIHHPDEISRLNRPYEQFLKEEGKPSDTQHEPRPPAPKHAVPQPYDQNPADQASDGSVAIERLDIRLPEANDNLRQARVRLRNRNPFEVQVTLRQAVKSPGGSSQETQSEPQRLGPHEEREVILPAYRFPNHLGEYLFDVSAWVGGRLIGRLPLPHKVEVK